MNKRVERLAPFLKNMKLISFLSRQIYSQYSSRCVFLFGNESNDPDSVFGCISMSILLLISDNYKKEKFVEHFNYITKDFDVSKANDLLTMTDLQFYVPIFDIEEAEDVAMRLDIKYLDEKFEVGLFHGIDLNYLSSMNPKSGFLRIGLCDHNLPGSRLSAVLDRFRLQKEICIDHHQIANHSYLSEFTKSRVELSGSCHSVLFRNYADDIIDLFAETYPNLLKLSALIISIDSFDFLQLDKGKRWFDFDENICNLLKYKSGYGNSKQDITEFLSLKFSDKQFEIGFRRLYYSDSKFYEYSCGKRIEYAVFYASIQRYLNEFGEQQIIKDAECLMNQRYVLTPFNKIANLMQFSFSLLIR